MCLRLTSMYHISSSIVLILLNSGVVFKTCFLWIRSFLIQWRPLLNIVICQLGHSVKEGPCFGNIHCFFFFDLSGRRMIRGHFRMQLHLHVILFNENELWLFHGKYPQKEFCIYQILIFGAESGMMMLRISSSFFGFACMWYKFFRVWILCFFIKQYSMLPSPKKYSKNYLVPPPVASCTVVSNLLVRAFPNP